MMSREERGARAGVEPGPTPDEYLGLARRSYDAFNVRDLDTLISLYHPDCIWDMTNWEGWPDTPVYRGHDGLRRLFEEWFAAWDQMHVWFSDVRLLGGGRSVGTAHLRGRGGASGVEVILDWTQVAEVRGRLIYSVENYTDRSRALEAVGLRE